MDRFASNFDWRTWEIHGNDFKLSGSTKMAKIYYTSKIVQVRVNGGSNLAALGSQASFHMNYQRSTFKGAVTVSARPPCKDGHVRFTTVPFYIRNVATKNRPGKKKF